MTQRDETAPSSPASASALGAPSEAAAEFEARAAEAAAKVAADEAKQRAEEEAAKQKKRDEEKEARENFARAPTSIVHQVRFFFLVMSFVVISMVVALDWFESDPLFPWQAMPIAYGAWFAVLLFFVIDAATWRRRLPFTLDGYDRIGGGHTFEKDQSPWIAYRVCIELDRETTESKRARDQALELLALRVNALMKKKDEDHSYSEERAWRVSEKKTGELKGEYSRQMYRLRIFEKWLRSDVALLAKAYPIRRVVVDAQYTGSSRMIISTD